MPFDSGIQGCSSSVYKNKGSEILIPNDAGLVGCGRKLRKDHIEQLQVYSKNDASNSTHPHTPEST